jgi:hypothetical protein
MPHPFILSNPEPSEAESKDLLFDLCRKGWESNEPCLPSSSRAVFQSAVELDLLLFTVRNPFDAPCPILSAFFCGKGGKATSLACPLHPEHFFKAQLNWICCLSRCVIRSTPRAPFFPLFSAERVGKLKLQKYEIAQSETRIQPTPT